MISKSPTMLYLLSLLSAFVLAVGCALAFGSPPARALDPTVGAFTPEKVLSPSDELVLRNVIADTRSADAARAAQARGAMTRAATKTVGPRLIPVLARAGLPGAAAGIWIHNGMTIYYYNKSGVVGSVAVDSEFRPAAGAVFGTSESDRPGEDHKGHLMLTRVKIEPQAGGYYHRITYNGVRSVDRWIEYHSFANFYGYTSYTGCVGIYNEECHPNTLYSGEYKEPQATPPYESAWQQVSSNNQCHRIAGKPLFGRSTSSIGGVTSQKESFSNLAVPSDCTGTFEPPTFEVGSMQKRPAAPDDFATTAQEARDLVTAVRGDADYNPIWAEHPWDKPHRKWTEIRPPGTDDGDQEIFGPYVKGPYVRENFTFWEHADGTYRWFDSALGQYVYDNGARSIWFHPDDPKPYDYHEKDKGWYGLACLPDGRYDYLKSQYRDGVTREQWFKPNTPIDQLHVATPECEVWKDAQGNEMPAPDPQQYGRKVLSNPPAPLTGP